MSGVIGHTEGLKKQDIARLDKLYRRRIRGDSLMSYELAEELCELSLAIKREITVFLDPQGRVGLVMVVDADSLDQLPAVELPSPDAGLSKHTCIHTHLGWKPPSLGDQVTLLQFHFPVMVVLMAGTAEGFSRRHGETPRYCDGAYLVYAVTEKIDGDSQKRFQRACELKGPMLARALEEENLETWVEWTQPVFEENGAQTRADRERAVLLGVYRPDGNSRHPESESRLEDSLDELRQLAKTAGADILGEVTQARQHPDPRTYIGSGKAEEAAMLIQQWQADVVIADDELSPVQQRNLEQVLRTKVVDRTELILDIFAQRALSREGKIQVELAQLQYEMPRLKGRGRVFSQQTAVGAKGGIATRGPGETKLETDRRVIRQRVTMLEKQAQDVVRHRQFQSQSRRQSNVPLVALVGYTNAGKSTLMRTLTRSDVLVADKLFATLDPTTRRLFLNAPSDDPTATGQEILLSDTVGFISKLPTFLIKAFRATLEEVATADLLLHVWDISHPDRLHHLESVDTVLASLWEELQLPETQIPPIWTVCNKIDRLPNWAEELDTLRPHLEQPYAVSATTGEGLPTLLSDLSAFTATLAEKRLQAATPEF